MHKLEQHASFLTEWPAAIRTTPVRSAHDAASASFAFAQTHFCFHGLDARLNQAFEEHYGPARTSSVGAEPSEAPPHTVSLHYHRVTDRSFRRPDTCGWKYDLGLSFDESSVRMSGLDYVCIWNRSSHTAEIYWNADLEDPVDLLENPFRLACAYYLLDRGGVMLHSAGIASKRRAIVCWGRSGAGKSTLSGLCQQAGFDVLSDELNALLPFDDGFCIQAMPFAGDLGRTHTSLNSYEVAGLFTLQQTRKPELSSLRRARATGSLTAAAPFVNTDPYSHERVFDVLGQLLSRYGAQTLGFPKTNETPLFLRNEIFATHEHRLQT